MNDNRSIRTKTFITNKRSLEPVNGHVRRLPLVIRFKFCHFNSHFMSVDCAIAFRSDFEWNSKIRVHRFYHSKWAVGSS